MNYTNKQKITRRSLREDNNVFVWDGTSEVPKDVEHVRIADGVTTIGDHAFKSRRLITSVTIPNSVTTIDEYAFSDCQRLTSVTIPDSVTTIGEGAFELCSGLTSVTIGNGVTSIGDWAFAYCFGLTSLTIGNSVKSIGEGAFHDCRKLHRVTPSNIVQTYPEAFDLLHSKDLDTQSDTDEEDELDDLSWSEMLDDLDGDEDWMDSLYQEFYHDAYKLVEKEGFTDVFTEPSTQLGHGADFFWAKKDGVSYEGRYDFESEQDLFWDCCYEADSREEAVKLCATKYAKIILDNLKPVEN